MKVEDLSISHEKLQSLIGEIDGISLYGSPEEGVTVRLNLGGFTYVLIHAKEDIQSQYHISREGIRDALQDPDNRMLLLKVTAADFIDPVEPENWDDDIKIN